MTAAAAAAAEHDDDNGEYPAPERAPALDGVRMAARAG